MTKTTALQTLNYRNAELTRQKHAVDVAVIQANDAGASWSEIGKTLGISKQTAYARYSKLKCECGCGGTLASCTTPLPEGPARELTDEEEAREALGEWALEQSKISDTDVAGDSETPSIFSDAESPAPAHQISGVTIGAPHSLPKRCPFCQTTAHTDSHPFYPRGPRREWSDTSHRNTNDVGNIYGVWTGCTETQKDYKNGTKDPRDLS